MKIWRRPNRILGVKQSLRLSFGFMCREMGSHGSCTLKVPTPKLVGWALVRSTKLNLDWIWAGSGVEFHGVCPEHDLIRKIRGYFHLLLYGYFPESKLNLQSISKNNGLDTESEIRRFVPR